MLAEIYRDEWGVSELLDSQVLRETQAIFGKAIEKGVPRSTPHRTAFKQRLKTSTDVFSVFRVHRQAEDIAAHLTDEHGNRRSFGEWAERVQPYLNHQNRAWLQTEYSTAIRRAHDEADWVRFREDADIYPNLEWVPSTSAQPGADHKVFWGTVLPIGDEFWTEHRPGDRWNCKCSLRQTDKAPTATPRVSGAQHAPQPGLRAKPGSEEVFSEDHAYYPDGCSFCVFAKGLRGLMANLSSKAKPFSKDGTCLGCSLRRKCMNEGTYFNDPKYGKRLQSHRDADMRDYDENIRCAQTILDSLPKSMIKIREHVTEQGVKNPEYDISLDKGKTWQIGDRKSVESENGVTSAFKKGIKQGCKVIVIDFDLHNADKKISTSKLAQNIRNRRADFLSKTIDTCIVVINKQTVCITVNDIPADRVLSSQMIQKKLRTIIHK